MANKEIEKRFLVTEVADNFPLSLYHTAIKQGYVELATNGKSFRVRIKNSSEVIFTVKSGSGLVRGEEEISNITADVADFLFRYLCDHTVEKQRYSLEGWEIDFFEEPLRGIIVAEKEFKKLSDIPDNLRLPEWIGKGIEVTNSLTSHHLARLATLIKGTDKKAIDVILNELNPPIPKIVITGPPCSGKTGMIKIIRDIKPEFQYVPEVATIVIAELGISPGKNELANIKFQKTLYRIQKVFEATSAEFALDNKKIAIIQDRGIPDNLGYFPGGLKQFQHQLKTTLEEEYDSYRGVLCLEVAPRDIYNLEKSNNSARSETYEEACALQEKMIEAWQKHPNFIFVPNGSGWEDKKRRVFEAINDLLRGESK